MFQVVKNISHEDNCLRFAHLSVYLFLCFTGLRKYYWLDLPGEKKQSEDGSWSKLDPK